MFRTAPVLLALLASGAAASECTVPKFHSSYAISGRARGTYESDSTNADFPDFLEVDLNSEAADKFGDQDGGFFTMVRDWDESGYYGKYACMITSSGGHALCTSLGDDIEEGPIMRVSADDNALKRQSLLSSYFCRGSRTFTWTL